MTTAVDFWSGLAAQHKTTCDVLRGVGPVAELDGVYYLTRRDDVLAALHNPEVFSSARVPLGRAFDVLNLPVIPTVLDPPEHTHYRAILQPLFGPDVVKALVPTFTEHAKTLIDAVVADGECDAMAAVALPFPVACLQTFFGLPPEDGEVLNRVKYTILAGARGSAPYLTAIFELFGYLARVITARRENPDLPGLLGRLPAQLSDTEAVAASYVLFAAGASNEVAAIGYALLALASDPQLRAVLRADPGQVRVFVDEILRLEPAEPNVQRVTTQDVSVSGVTIPAGSGVKLYLSTINREDNSDNICVADGRITRHRHWSFGHGPHRCPAAYLARMEVRVLVTEWLRRVPDFEVGPGYRPPLPFNDVFRGGFVLPSLPLRWATS